MTEVRLEVERSLHQARRYLSEGRADLAIRLLKQLVEENPDDPEAWKLLGFALHEEQLEPEAAVAFTRATALDDRDPTTAMALAQSCFLSGLPAVEPFRRLMELVPNELNALRGYALALSAENRCDTAEAVLCAALEEHPDWLVGHKLLATQRYTAGEKYHFADSYRDACAAQPGNLALRLDWFRTVAQTRNWTAAQGIVDDGEKLFGTHPQLLLARLFIASECGDDEQAARLFTATATYDDVVRDMALVRNSLRRGDLKTAEATAMRRIGTSSERVFWPYLSLIWRQRGISEAVAWLDGSPPYVSSFDLDLSAGELNQLAALLRRLHTAVSPFAEQSVRGGTQTDQNLFLRHEPILRDLKSRIQAAVTRYVEALPPVVPGHPLLGVNREQPMRGRMQFTGSWSVQLQSQGFNVSHTHPMGWISSALYIALPKPEEMGAPPSGWIQFGTPPPELKLGLQPYLKNEPKVGRLLLFPSTMWHSTVPFDDGERLVVAFDVRPPGGAAKPITTARSS